MFVLSAREKLSLSLTVDQDSPGTAPLANSLVQFDAGFAARYAALAGDSDRALRFIGLIENAERHEQWLRSVMGVIAAADAQRAEEIAETRGPFTT